jgi:hypothetical protein
VQQRRLGWGSEHHDRNPSATERTEFIQLWLETLRPDQTTLEQHNHYAREDRFDRWLQIVWSKCSPSDGPMVAQRCRSTRHPTGPVEQADPAELLIVDVVL